MGLSVYLHNLTMYHALSWNVQAQTALTGMCNEQNKVELIVYWQFMHKSLNYANLWTQTEFCYADLKNAYEKFNYVNL